VRRIAGRDRPAIALDAVDRDGHHLRILVDGDVDFGLGRVRGKQHQTQNCNEKGTHVTLASGPDCRTIHVPGSQYA